MPSISQAKLILNSESGFPVYRVRDFLNALDRAYNYIYVAQILFHDRDQLRSALAWMATENERRFGRLVPLSERLLLIEVELHSPGFWKFLGVDGILEQIRLYLQDRHERGKDKQYRESQERRGLELENKLREAELMRRRIEVAKELGASEEELRSVLQHFVLQPLNELDKYQDQGLITGVESELASGEK